MRRKAVHMRINKIAILLILVLGIGQTVSKATNDFFAERANYIYSQIEVPDLPNTELYRLGITVDESILSDPNLASRTSVGLGGGCTYENGKSWVGGSFDFDTRYEIPNPKRSSWFKKRPKILVKGFVRITILNADSSKSAFKCLVFDASLCSMPDGPIISEFAEKNKLEDIGTVGFHHSIGMIRFIRDNIAVIIRCDGVFQSQALEIARKIDKRLLKQPLYTYQQLVARCPKVSFRHKRHKVIREKGRTPVVKPDDIFCDIYVPKGRTYAIRDSKLNGKGVCFKNGKIYFDDRREDRTKPLELEMTVVSDELLAAGVTSYIEISGNTEGKDKQVEGAILPPG